MDANKLREYDIVVYGGGLCSSGIAGISIVTKNYEKLKDKRAVVFTVGLASVDREEAFSPIIESELSDDDKELLATYGGKVDFVDKSTIAPLVLFLQS